MNFSCIFQIEMRQNSERIFNLVSESLHYLGHIYHSVSDLSIDLNQSPPRHLHAHTALPTLPGLLPSGITPGSIPVQVNQASKLIAFMLVMHYRKLYTIITSLY